MKRVLLTGAGGRGFIGRTLKEQMASKYDIFAPPHKELDLCEAEDVKRYIATNKIEAVVHAAVHVPSVNGQSDEYLNDMKMFMNLERLCGEVDKIVYFGSGAEYDKRYDITMATEEMIGNSMPVSEYGFAKYTMNAIARQSSNIYNLRLFGVFGKNEPWQVKFISTLCYKAVHQLPLTVRKDCAFDFLYVDDMMPVVDWVLENSPAYHDYNLCSGTSHLLSEIAEMVKEMAEISEDILFLNEGRDLDYTGDNTRLKSDMPTFAPTPLPEAVEKLYRYICENKHLVDYDTAKRVM